MHFHAVGNQHVYEGFARIDIDIVEHAAGEKGHPCAGGALGAADGRHDLAQRLVGQSRDNAAQVQPCGGNGNA